MKLLPIILLSLILVSATVLSHVDAKSKDSKAKSAIIKAISRAVEGKYSTIKLIQLSKSNVSGYVTIYNITSPLPSPTPTPTPIPVPLPTGPTTKVCLVGDLKGSDVPNLMKDCNLKIGLGDLGYADTLSWFKSLNFNHCSIGNHDSLEDSTSAMYKEALAYCGDHWSFKPTPNVLILGFNTNSDPSIQVNWAKKQLSDTNNMANVKTVIFVSHKAGHVPPNSHHPAEASSLYKQVEALIPSSIKLFEVAGHNHLSSASDTMRWYQAGSGGKSFYSCGTDAVFNFCDNKNLAFLQLTIDNSNGNTVAHFIGEGGKILH